MTEDYISKTFNRKSKKQITHQLEDRVFHEGFQINSDELAKTIKNSLHKWAGLAFNMGRFQKL